MSLRDLRSVSLRVGPDKLTIRERSDSRVAIVVAVAAQDDGMVDNRYVRVVARHDLAALDPSSVFAEWETNASKGALVEALLSLIPKAQEWWEKPALSRGGAS